LTATTMSKPNPRRDELRQSLTQLHTELAATSRVDAASMRLLREVLADIERLLGASGVAEASAHPAASVSSTAVSAPQRLEALAVEFEAWHPTLAGSLRQFVDLLGRAGL
jgi:hypothetical protein